MTMRSTIRAALLAASALAALPASAAEEHTIKAFSSWTGQGQIFQTGPEQATFVGALAGPVFVETEKGPVQAGDMICPAILTIGTKDGAMEGRARCAATAKDGAQAFGEVTCQGFHMIGCDGTFTFTGGTGRFAGVEGGGKVIIRTEIGVVAQDGSGATGQASTGITYWPELKYTLPEAATTP